MVKICPTCKNQYEGGEVFCPVDASRLVTHSQLDASHDPDVDPLEGATLDRYKIVRRIGEGGMGFVYEAIHTAIEKRVAIKLLRKDYSSKADVVERFRQEAKSASRIGHEHIVDISDFGETPTGESYFVMEFLEGQDLANLLAKEGVLPAKRAIDILVQCCRALGAAHAKGIVHRDMKPENIFLVRRDHNPDFVKIVDFGIAKMNEIETPGEPGRKLTKTGMIFGTPEYMSPEQAAGKPIDHRVDIYAVGVILFELLTGRVPFVGDSFMGILTQHMFEPVPAFAEVNANVSVPLEVEFVLLKALAKKPDERFQTMDELAAALEGAAAGRAMELVAASAVSAKPLAAPQTQGRGVTALRVDEPDAVPTRTTRMTPGEPTKRGNRAVVPVVLALVAVGAAGAYLAFGRTQRDGHEVVTTPAPEPGATSTTASTAGADDAVDPAAAERVDAGLGATSVGGGTDPEQVAAGAPDAGPAMVVLMVDTRPAGASVAVTGTETRCSPSPCSLEVVPGAAITLHAEVGSKTGELELTPTQAMAVMIPLASRGGSARSTGTASTQRGSGGTRGGDLRVPDIFR